MLDGFLKLTRGHQQWPQLSVLVDSKRFGGLRIHFKNLKNPHVRVLIPSHFHFLGGPCPKPPMYTERNTTGSLVQSPRLIKARKLSADAASPISPATPSASILPTGQTKPARLRCHRITNHQPTAKNNVLSEVGSANHDFDSTCLKVKYYRM